MTAFSPADSCSAAGSAATTSAITTVSSAGSPYSVITASGSAACPLSTDADASSCSSCSADWPSSSAADCVCDWLSTPSVVSTGTSACSTSSMFPESVILLLHGGEVLRGFARFVEIAAALQTDVPKCFRLRQLYGLSLYEFE